MGASLRRLGQGLPDPWEGAGAAQEQIANMNSVSWMLLLSEPADEVTRTEKSDFDLMIMET